PFDFRHLEQTIDQIEAAAVTSITRSSFVFLNVAAFEFTRAVHGRKPSGHVTKQPQSSADDRRAKLAPFTWRGAKTRKHFAHQSAMTPLVFFNLANRIAFSFVVD